MSETTVPSPPSLSSFWRDLPREGRLMLSVVVVPAGAGDDEAVLSEQSAR